MATTKPRITITLNPRTYEVLKAIGELGGQPMSGFVSEMLDSALPTLERMAVTFQKVKQAHNLERAKFLETIDDAQAVIEPVVMEALGQFDLFMNNIDEAVEGRQTSARNERPLPPSAAAAAPHTNRGVTPKTITPPKPSKAKALKGVAEKKVLKKSGLSNEHKHGVKRHAV